MSEAVSRSVAETEQIAGAFARRLVPGSVVALHGEMGAGKTQFVRGIVQGLGGSGRAVSSPTFALLNIYQTPAMPVFHLDAYRTAGEEDFAQIGFEELLEQQGVVIVEWPTRVAGLLPIGTLAVMIEATGASTRRIVLPD